MTLYDTLKATIDVKAILLTIVLCRALSERQLCCSDHLNNLQYIEELWMIQYGAQYFHLVRW